MFNDQGPIRFYGCTDLVVLERDPEYADVSNPEGCIYGAAPYVIAEDETGHRRVITAGRATRSDREALATAEKLAAALTNRFERLGKLPVAFAKRWSSTRPCYGSEAYQESGQEQEDAWLERQEDERGW